MCGKAVHFNLVFTYFNKPIFTFTLKMLLLFTALHGMQVVCPSVGHKRVDCQCHFRRKTAILRFSATLPPLQGLGAT